MFDRYIYRDSTDSRVGLLDVRLDREELSIYSKDFMVHSSSYLKNLLSNGIRPFASYYLESWLLTEQLKENFGMLAVFIFFSYNTNMFLSEVSASFM